MQYAGGAIAAAPLAAAKPDQASDPADFLAVFAKRETIRRYKSDPVPEEHIRRILDAARRGPTCMNQQPWKFLVVRDKAKIAEMKKRMLDKMEKYFAGRTGNAEEIAQQKAKSASYSEGIFSAPVYIVVLVDNEAPCSGYALKHDGPIAAAYLMLAARAFGYGTAYLTDGISDDVTREVLQIPARYARICITPLGVPEKWTRKEKRKLEEHVAWETLEGHPPLEKLPYNP
jgi:nitroreductase